MDDRTDVAINAVEKKLGPAECDCNGTCEMSYQLNGETRHYKNKLEKIEDEHFSECPVSVSARQQRISTLCVCDEIEAANKSAEECLRCHNLAADCKCGSKAQLV